MGELIDLAVERIKRMAKKAAEMTQERRDEIMKQLLKEADELDKDKDDE